MMHLAYNITDDKYEHVGSQKPLADSNATLARDDFDANAWLVSVRLTRKIPSRAFLSEESLPQLLEDYQDDPSPRHSDKEAAVIGVNAKGNLFVEWLNPEYKSKYIHVGAVMNRGTYCVNEFCPVSKAHLIFTALGLRHLIVLGGPTGGQVVGILTRINFLREYIEERTRCDLGDSDGITE